MCGVDAEVRGEGYRPSFTQQCTQGFPRSWAGLNAPGPWRAQLVGALHTEVCACWRIGANGRVGAHSRVLKLVVVASAFGRGGRRKGWPRSSPRMRHPTPAPPRKFRGCGWAVSEPHHSEPNVRCMYRIHFAPADACGIRCSMPPGPPPRKRHTRQRPRPLLFRCMRRHFQAFWFSSGPAAPWSSTRAFWIGSGRLAVAGPIRTVIWLGQRAQAPFPIHSYMGYGLAGMGTLSARALHRLCLRQILCRARSMRNPSFGPPGRLATSQLQFQTGSPEGEP